MRKQHWHIVARNIRYVGTELDIVATKGKTLAIIEVKRRRRRVETAADAAMLLPPRKRQALRRGAACFLARHPSLRQFEVIRFDLAVIVLDERKEAAERPLLEYFPNAIESP